MTIEDKIFTIEEGTVACIPCEGGWAIKRYRGIGGRAVIPDKIEGMPVVAIEKKAFLSCKTLREIRLPDSIQRIGDWAFAHAEALCTVWIPSHELACGKELFLGCMRLREIRLLADEETMKLHKRNGIDRMLAAAVTALHDYYLLSPPEVGSKEWLTKWDERLLAFLHTDDLEGYEELWTCGEEDYEGKGYDSQSYPVEKRKSKLRLVYYRLLHPHEMADSVGKELQLYLREHTKGTKEPEAWEILLQEHGEEIAYYQVFTEAGCVREDNIDALLEDMQHVGAELKAYLLHYKQEHLQKKDAFAQFTLDW